MYTRANLAAVRIKKDVSELTSQQFSCGQASTLIEFPEGQKNLLKIRVTVRMTGGLYQRGVFSFIMDIPGTYPFHAPTVTCITRVWHPNIDVQTGRVFLPILGKEWRPVLSINAVVFGLQLLFLEPIPEFPANTMAADALVRNPEMFKAQVRQTMEGGTFFGVDFPCQTRHHGAANNLKRKSHDRMEDEEEDDSWSRGGGVTVRGVHPGMMPDAELKCDLEAMCIQDLSEEEEEGAEAVDDGDGYWASMTRPCRKRACVAPTDMRESMRAPELAGALNGAMMMGNAGLSPGGCGGPASPFVLFPQGRLSPITAFVQAPP